MSLASPRGAAAPGGWPTGGRGFQVWFRNGPSFLSSLSHSRGVTLTNMSSVFDLPFHGCLLEMEAKVLSLPEVIGPLVGIAPEMLKRRASGCGMAVQGTCPAARVSPQCWLLPGPAVSAGD